MRSHLVSILLASSLLLPIACGAGEVPLPAAEPAAPAHVVAASRPDDSCGALPEGRHDGPAALPLREPDVSLLDSSGWRSYSVRPSGGDFSSLQRAYDRAIAADENVRIEVAVGFDAGPLVLRNRGGKTHWIYVQPDSAGRLPRQRAAGDSRARQPDARDSRRAHVGELHARPSGPSPTRATPGSSAPTSRSPTTANTARIHTSCGFAADAKGSDPERLEATPRNIILDRCYVHIPTDGTRFAGHLVGFYGRDLALIDSSVVGGGRGWEATKAVSSGYAPGPLLVENNYLATDGINVFLGASEASHNGWVPSDVTIRRNHIHKDAAWRGNPRLLVKNGFEIKNARRVLFERNVLENNWVDAQTGRMILLRAEAENGICEDVTIRYNRIENTPSVWDLAGMDEDRALRSLRRVSIHDNVATRIGGHSDFGDAGAILQLSTQADRPIRASPLRPQHARATWEAPGSRSTGWTRRVASTASSATTSSTMDATA